MKTYHSPVYPALMARLPRTRSAVKAEGGRFNVPDELVEEFEEFVAQRPHYRIVPVEAKPVAEVEAESAPEKTERVTNAQLRDALAAMGLPTKGNRADLEARLAEAQAAADAEDDDDELSDDDDEEESEIEETSEDDTEDSE